MAPSPTRPSLSEKRREEEEGLIHTPATRTKRQRCLRQGLAVLECFRAWAFANPRRLLLGTLTSSLIIAYILYKLLHHVPAPPSPWRAQCRSDFPTHYAVQRIRPKAVRSRRKPDRPEITHTLHPLTPSHPSWPYRGNEPPSLQDAASMAPVAVLVGVFTMDKDMERRELIRATYNIHRESRKVGTEGVKVLFVMGQPVPELADKVALESELYGDLLILDIKENMNDGKTHAYFAWAAQHAQVPSCHYAHVSHNLHTLESSEEVMERRRTSIRCEGTRQPDYVIKADDDSFIVLSELERRLRIIPREKAYWGLLMYGDYLQFQERTEYMAGEGYALSMDLVKFVASSEYALAHTIGHEDQLVGDWLRSHQAAEEIVWVTERCWMYDHPKAGKLLSHGFMFPDVVQSIQDDTDYFLPPRLPPHMIDIWSTVSPYNRPYRPPLMNLTIPQQLEALTEGSPMSMWHKHNRPFFPSTKSMSYHLGRAVGNLAQEVEKAWLRRPTRAERMKLADKMGSTVLVHKVRKDEWWMETALTLLGQEEERTS